LERKKIFDGLNDLWREPAALGFGLRGQPDDEAARERYGFSDGGFGGHGLGLVKISYSAHSFAFVSPKRHLAAIFKGRQIDLIQWNARIVQIRLGVHCAIATGNVLHLPLKLHRGGKRLRLIVPQTPPLGIAVVWAKNARRSRRLWVSIALHPQQTIMSPHPHIYQGPHIYRPHLSAHFHAMNFVQ
jgi:hypothetical protein